VKINNVLSKVDLDQNGKISSTVFIEASLNKDVLFDEEKLKAAFNYFDKDKRGHLKA